MEPTPTSADTRRSAVLLVEDEAVHATLIGETLRRLVDHVEHVSTGTEAFSALADRRFDLVILDLNLPDVSGMTVLKWMRGQGDRTPVIFVTVEDDVERGVEAMRLLATNYVPKRLGYLDKVIAAVMEVLAQPLPNGAVPAAGSDQAAQTRPARGVFRREGEYWTTAYGGTVCRLKDTRGLRYLAYLLRHPGQEYLAVDLLATAGEVIEGPSPSSKTLPPGEGHVRTTLDDGLGPLLDGTARAQYRARLAELREMAAEAERLNDPLRAARAQEESEAIKSHLKAALGLGGRQRPAASPAERARLAVTRGIKGAIKKSRESRTPTETPTDTPTSTPTRFGVSEPSLTPTFPDEPPGSLACNLRTAYVCHGGFLFLTGCGGSNGDLSEEPQLAATAVASARDVNPAAGNRPVHRRAGQELVTLGTRDGPFIYANPDERTCGDKHTVSATESDRTFLLSPSLLHLHRPVGSRVRG